MKNRYEVTLPGSNTPALHPKTRTVTVDADYMEVERGDLCFYREEEDDEGDDLVQTYAKGHWISAQEKPSL